MRFNLHTHNGYAGYETTLGKAETAAGRKAERSGQPVRIERDGRAVAKVWPEHERNVEADDTGLD